MENQNYYYIMSFETTTDAMLAEKCAKEHILASIMPVPREISSGCGLALRFMEEDEKSILAFCRNTPLNGTLYKMWLKKVDGKHPIEQLGTGYF